MQLYSPFFLRLLRDPSPYTGREQRDPAIVGCCFVSGLLGNEDATEVTLTSVPRRQAVLVLFEQRL